MCVEFTGNIEELRSLGFNNESTKLEERWEHYGILISGNKSPNPKYTITLLEARGFTDDVVKYHDSPTPIHCDTCVARYVFFVNSINHTINQDGSNYYRHLQLETDVMLSIGKPPTHKNPWNILLIHQKTYAMLNTLHDCGCYKLVSE